MLGADLNLLCRDYSPPTTNALLETMGHRYRLEAALRYRRRLAVRNAIERRQSQLPPYALSLRAQALGENEDLEIGPRPLTSRYDRLRRLQPDQNLSLGGCGQYFLSSKSRRSISAYRQRAGHLGSTGKMGNYRRGRC